MAFAGRVGDARAIGTLIFFGYFNHPEQEGNWVGLLYHSLLKEPVWE